MFESLSESLPEGIVLFKEKIIYSNPVFEKLSKFNGRELKEKSFMDLISLEGQLKLREICNSIELKYKPLSAVNVELYQKNGADLFVRIKLKSVLIETEQYFLAIVTDISRDEQEKKHLNQLAFFDGLTGIYNRRKIDELMKVEYERAKRYERNLCILFFDIDHFKKINDNFGHDVGDNVLKTMAKLLQTNIRITDFLGRWGGEEFILILPETSIEYTESYAEEIRSVIESQVFELVGHITISIGVTNLKGKERMETLLKRLDNALYKAKNNGRNQVVRI